MGDKQTDKQTPDLISLLSFLESRLRTNCNRMNISFFRRTPILRRVIYRGDKLQEIGFVKLESIV
jgi:hypothetical protein